LSDFGGFVDRLFYRSGDLFGLYCASIYNGKLRIQIGFNTDMPKEIREELLLLIVKHVVRSMHLQAYGIQQKI
jgi:hypothetical protein